MIFQDFPRFFQPLAEVYFTTLFRSVQRKEEGMGRSIHSLPSLHDCRDGIPCRWYMIRRVKAGGGFEARGAGARYDPSAIFTPLWFGRRDF